MTKSLKEDIKAKTHLIVWKDFMEGYESQIDDEDLNDSQEYIKIYANLSKAVKISLKVLARAERWQKT